MIKFDEAKLVASVNGALALRPQIEKIVDEICEKGYDSLVYMGIGGTWASALQAEAHIRERSGIPMYASNAAEFNASGDRRITDKTVVIYSSVSGNTKEMVIAAETLKKTGATIFAFVDAEGTPLATIADHCIIYPENEQLKFFMAADRFMFNAGDYDDYEECYAQYDAHLAQDLADVQKASDEWARAYAERHHDDYLHYFIGAGTQYGSTYSYAMCYWEEQHWLLTKSIHSAEFFHGTLEIIERDTPVTLFLGEDTQRPLSERVARFLPRVCANYELIDAADYEMPGIDKKHRANISHLITHMVTERIDVHIEDLNRHPMEIRRYYRQFDY